MRPTRGEQITAATPEELVQGIVAVIERTFTTAGPTGPTADLAEFFRALDEPTLRAIAYRHGVFDGLAEVDPEADDPDEY